MTEGATPMPQKRDAEFAAAIAAAFQPGVADAVRWTEAEDRARNQARALGLDPDAVIDRAKFRYVRSPRGGLEAWTDILHGVIAEEML